MNHFSTLYIETKMLKLKHVIVNPKFIHTISIKNYGYIIHMKRVSWGNPENSTIYVNEEEDCKALEQWLKGPVLLKEQNNNVCTKIPAWWIN